MEYTAVSYLDIAAHYVDDPKSIPRSNITYRLWAAEATTVYADRGFVWNKHNLHDGTFKINSASLPVAVLPSGPGIANSGSTLR